MRRPGVILVLLLLALAGAAALRLVLGGLDGEPEVLHEVLAAGGVDSIGPEDAHATMEALVDAFRASRARVALIASTDACYAEHAENAAQRLKAAGATWVVLAGKPGDNETRWRAAGVDQFIFAGVDALKELETLHAALGVGA